jgi:hypothetical protein
MTSGFPPSLRGISIHTVPRTFSSASSSSRRLVHSSECVLPLTRPMPSSNEHLPWSFSPPSRHQPKESTTRQPSTAAFVPPSAFHTLSTAYSSLYLASLFHPAATSEIPFQGISPVISLPDSSPGRTLMSLAPLSCEKVAPLAPDTGTPPSGFCSDYRSVVADSAVTPCRRPIPS